MRVGLNSHLYPTHKKTKHTKQNKTLKKTKQKKERERGGFFTCKF